jgi:thiol-disulfide isomerase/thioredoxin
MPQLGSMLPSFEGVPSWRYGPPPEAVDLEGKPVLVHFFSSGCPLCREGMPVIRRLHAAFAPRGLVVVGAYQPRPDAKAAPGDAGRESDLHIGPTHACALDDDGVLAKRFENEWAPGYYIYDRSHFLRHYQMGNWNLDELAALIKGCVGP